MAGSQGGRQEMAHPSLFSSLQAWEGSKLPWMLPFCCKRSIMKAAPKLQLYQHESTQAMRPSLLPPFPLKVIKAHSCLWSHYKTPHPRDVMKGYKVSAFGDWNFYDEKPIAQGLQSIMETDFVQAHFFVGDGEDLFKVLSPYGHQPKTTVGSDQFCYCILSGVSPCYAVTVCEVLVQGKKIGIEGEGKKVYYEEKRRKPKAVDEDLYKIPPELLYQIPKKVFFFFFFFFFCWWDFMECSTSSFCRRSWSGNFGQDVCASTALPEMSCRFLGGTFCMRDCMYFQLRL
ncbi:hypothetical protein B296_00045745 [Ensete ventricosum]|uniref:Uncharacterized protein n=1 Tax=Ensete ventricosum TaxID=4639 RepID=A0A426XRL7_ENSVE|nr:hypothetical protein B296_00045745 [Ensete ventricosum]